MARSAKHCSLWGAPPTCGFGVMIRSAKAPQNDGAFGHRTRNEGQLVSCDRRHSTTLPAI